MLNFFEVKFNMASKMPISGDFLMANSQIILESSLQVFFYDLLQEINRKSQIPLSNETIFYSSLVLEKLSHSQKYFEVVDGKVREKILGLKLLESNNLPKEQMKHSLFEVAETSLMLCGFFSDSFNRKIIDSKYYQEVGIMAYSRLNSLEPKAYNINSFYKKVSQQFTLITSILSIAAEQANENSETPFLIITKKVS